MTWSMVEARLHHTTDVFEMLNEHIDKIIIGLDYPLHFQGFEWPPYSPDLHPCNFFQRFYLNSK